MKTIKLSPLEKQWKIARDQLTYIRNRVRGAFGLGYIKVFKDLLIHYGLSEHQISAAGYFASELSRKVTIKDVNEYLSDRHIELETKIWLTKNPPIIERDSDIQQCLPSVPMEIVEEIPLDAKKLSDEITDKLPDNPLAKDAFFYWYQRKAINSILKLVKEHQHACGLVAQTGSGKTFMAGWIISYLIHSKYHEGKTFTPWPYIVVTKAQVVEQFKRVLTNVFHLDCDEDSPHCQVLVINIEQLRSQFGKRFVREESVVHRGEHSIVWKWRKNIYPIVIVWDEAHSLKREYSEQSQIAQSYNDLDDNNTFQIFMSATLLSRVADAKCLAVATRVPYTYGLQENAPLTNNHWKDFSKNIASDYGASKTDALDYSEAAVDRLMEKLDPWMVRVKGIKSQFKAYNRIVMIDFTTREGREYYDNAIDRYLEAKAKAESDESLSASERNICILVALLIFKMASESNPDAISYIGDDMVHDVKEGIAAGCALNHKISIARLTDYLNRVHGIPRSDISLIWGGKPVQNKKSVSKFKISHNADLMKMLKEQGISMKDLNLEDVEEQDEFNFPEHLKLGAQTRKDTQNEIDRFQKQESHYCIYSAKKGGVGLSLHHTDDLTKQKVRHKDSGYAYVEDIPLIPTWPRSNRVRPPWSDVELIQMLGRFPRINSLSDTHQKLIGLRGTIDARILARVAMKLRCLNRVTRQKEDWSDMMNSYNKKATIEEERQLADATQDIGDEDGALNNEMEEEE